MNDLPMDMLPEEIEAAERAMAERLAAKVEAFGESLRKKRDEAVAGRKQSGIEDEWTLAEDAYGGIDDANRGDTAVGKPSSPNGGYINGPARNAAVRSRVFLNITRPYTDSASAKVADMLLPTDDTPWSIQPTPLPELDQLMPEAQPGMQPGMQPPQMTQVQAAVEQVKQQAKKAAEGATEQIEDWLIECQWHGEVRKLIEDCARLGTGVLKGPFPTKRTNRVTKRADGMLAVMVEERIAPASKAISPWNFYPDPACGECIQDGSYVWESDTITARGLKDLKGLPGYLPDQIDLVLEEGPSGRHKTDSFVMGNVRAKDDDQFEIWYFTGFAQRDDLEAAGVEVPEEGDVAVPALVTMVNNHVVKAALQPLDDGEFPYDVIPWQRKPNVPWGTGVPVQINTPQRMLNAAARNMMDNAGYSAGPQLIMRRNAITPADGTWQITPRKVWFVNDGADVQAVNQAFMAVNIPTMQQDLMNIIQFALKMAEDVTGLPMLMQGQQGKAPETVGGMQMLNNNASVVLRRIARLFDDRITEPHIRRYYNWLMTYGDNEEIKGDFQIDARGSTALVERDIQNTAIMGMAQMVLNPAFGMDPEKWLKEALKAQRLDPERFLMDEDKKAEMAQQPPPMPPQVQAAQIRAEVDGQKLQAQMQIKQMELQAQQASDQMEMQIAQQRAQAEYDRDTAYVQAENQRTQIEYEAQMQELALKRELEMLKYANAQQLSLEAVKAKLAETAMKLNVQKELAGLKGEAPQVATPAMEPVGRAPNGQAFQR